MTLNVFSLGCCVTLAWANLCCALGREAPYSKVPKCLASASVEVVYEAKILAGTWTKQIGDRRATERRPSLHFVKDASGSLICYADCLADSQGDEFAVAEKYEGLRIATLVSNANEACKAACIVLGDDSRKLYITFLSKNTIKVTAGNQKGESSHQSLEGIFVRKCLGDAALALSLEDLEGAWCATFNSPDHALADTSKRYLNYSLYFHKFEDRLAYRGLFKLRASGRETFDTVLESAYKGEVLECLTLGAKGSVVDRCFLIDVATYARFVDEETLEIFCVDHNIKETGRVSIARNLAFKRYLVGTYKKMKPLT